MQGYRTTSYRPIPCAQMSFRNRLGLFFVLIVIVPMIAVAVLLFGLLGKSERSIGDANIRVRQDVARKLFADEVRTAQVPLEAVANDRPFQIAVITGKTARARARATELLAKYDIERIVLYEDGAVVLMAGDKTAIAPGSLEMTSETSGAVLGTLYVSGVDAGTYARKVERVANLEVIVRNGGRVLATTFRDRSVPATAAGTGIDETVKLGPESYRADVFGGGFLGQKLRVQTLGIPRANSAADAGQSRVVIGVILLGFLLLALACAVLVSRSL